MKVSASIAPDSCRLFLWGGGCFCVLGAVCGFPFATHGISRKMVCRCIVPLLFLYPAVAIQAFLLERVCRCTESQKERRFLFAIQGILRKMVCRCIVPLLFLYPAVAIQVFLLERVCRCTEPLHRTSAQNLCTNPLHEPFAQNRGTG